MKLSELIARYGDDVVTFQKVDDCTSSISMTKKGTRATFATPERVNLDGFEKLGLIVWLDRKKVAEIITADKAAPKGRT